MPNVRLNRRRNFLQLGDRCRRPPPRWPLAVFHCADALTREGPKPERTSRLLFVIAASGGASIIDSFLPVATESMVRRTATPRRARWWPTPTRPIVQPNGSNLQAACATSACPACSPGAIIRPRDFPHPSRPGHLRWCVSKIPASTTSWLKNGLSPASWHRRRPDASWRRWPRPHGERPAPGRIATWAAGGFIEPGDAQGRAARGYARAEVISRPAAVCAIGHARLPRGFPERAGAQSAIDRARAIREKLDDSSPFGQRFANERSTLRRRYLSTSAATYHSQASRQSRPDPAS